MTTQSKRIVDRAWSFAHVLRDDGLSYMAYTEQITFLLFLKMAHEQAEKAPSRPSLIPKSLGWPTLLSRDGQQLLDHYERVLETLSHKSGMLGAIFRKPRPDIQNAVTLRRLIHDLIDPIDWSGMEADVKGDIYEGLLARSAEESPRGAGQYFTPRELVKAIIECIRPDSSDTVCDPAAGTGGFLLASYQYVMASSGDSLSSKQKRHLASRFVRGWELVPNTARLCVMNLYLHGIDADPSPIVSGEDSLAGDPGERFSVVVTNPPFGKRSTVTVGNVRAGAEFDEAIYERGDFWTTTKNKQLNFVQHVKTLLTAGGRCAIVVPDNVLFEGGAGEIVRRNLLQQFDVHTLLRLPTGLFYAHGVKANVLFFDAVTGRKVPRTKRLWIYDLRSNMHFTLKTKPLTRSDLDEFVQCYKPCNRGHRKPTWSDQTPDGRWRCFKYEELMVRDKVSLDISWLANTDARRGVKRIEADTLAQAIADDLRSAMEVFSQVARSMQK